MTIPSRGYNPENDLNLVLAFLAQTHFETGTLRNWFPTRFENSHDQHVDDIRIWEDQGSIVAVANPEEPFVYYIQVKPEYSHLEAEIIPWIVSHSKTKKTGNTQTLTVVSLEENTEREQLLSCQGFTKSGTAGYIRLRPKDAQIQEPLLPDGFNFRAIHGREDYDRLAASVRKIFGHGDWFTGDIIESIRSCSFSIPELDIIIETPDGDIAAFCTFRVDPNSRIAELEPLATDPDYRKLGLAKAILLEGLKRLQKHTPTLTHIGGAADNPGANRLYDSAGFTEKHRWEKWSKEI